jgi:HlyD family secretion protein
VKLAIGIVVGLVVTIGIASGVGIWLKKRGMNNNADGTAVRIEKISKGNLTEVVTAPGIIQPKTKVSISAKVAARVVALPFKEGDVVSKGSATTQPSLLVELDSKDLEAQLRAAQARHAAQKSNIDVARARVQSQMAQIQSSRVQLADAERDLKRQMDLLGSHDVSQSVVDQAQAKHDQLKAELDASTNSLTGEKANLQVMEHQVEAAEAEIARAKDDLSYTKIFSPLDGVVTRLNAEVGELVVTGTMNNPGTVIMEVADLSTMLFKARVDESTIASVKAGQKAVVRVPAYKDREFNGVVTTVALANTEEKDGTKYFKTEILLDTQGLTVLSGLNADADIETEKHTDVLTVPSQAVLGRVVDDLPPGIRDKPEVLKDRTQTPVVYRVVADKAVVTPVKVGPSDITRTVIESGLNPGDVVIIGPYKVLEGLANDQKVRDERATTQPATKAG